MKILAIDTTSKICSVAILEDEKVIDEINLKTGLTHSENLMPTIKEILERSNMKLEDIELMGVDVGPGSFTGIRIGVASCIAIAEILNLKIASVTSLETLAREVNSEIPIASLIDARNDQVYCGVFDKDYNKIEEYLADDINIAIDLLKKYEKINLVGDGATLHEELLKEKISGANILYKDEQLASNVGKMALKKYKENKLETANTITPIYLRNKM